MKNNLRAVLLAAIITGLGAAPVFALSAQSGMPHEPVTKAGRCAKANGGVHIPYRGWHTKNLLGYRTCMWQ